MNHKHVALIMSEIDEGNANLNCALTVLKHLREKGFYIVLISWNTKKKVKRYIQKQHGFPVYLFSDSGAKLKSLSEKILKHFHRQGFLFRIFSGFYQLQAFEKDNNANVANSLLSFSRSVIAVENIGTILSISFPFINHVLASKIKENIRALKWVAYELDPHTYNYALPKTEIQQRALCEIHTFGYADRIILTQGIWEENQKHGFGNSFANKVVSVPLPNLHIETNRRRGTKSVTFDPKKINLLFAGNIYGNIRNPKAMLSLIKLADNDNIVLHVYGNGMERILKDYKFSEGRIVLHGRVPREVVTQAIGAASILINLGNSMPNQTPSKVFDYIASGKPIINFAYSDSDTSLHYLRIHPLHMTIFNHEALTPKSIKKFIEFCYENRYAEVPTIELTRLYSNLLSPTICEIIANQFLC